MPLNPTFFFRILVFPGLLFLLTLALFYDWVERKLAARMQNRMGPTYTGPAGVLQPFADYVKLFAKEDITPKGVNPLLYTSMPVLSFVLFTLAMLLVPIDGINALGNTGFEGDLILALVLSSLGALTIFLSGWASSNPYSEMGSVRVLTQFLGYDIPLILLSIAPATIVGSLSMDTIARGQTMPFAMVIPWVFLLFNLAMQAELEEDPFDVPHAGTELVAGYKTEFSGGRLAFLSLSKDMQLVFGVAITVTLFLGGHFGPILPGPSWLWYTIWFVVKSALVVSIIEGLECVCARLRIDQVLRGNWRLLVPLSVLCLMLTMLLRSSIQEAL